MGTSSDQRQPVGGTPPYSYKSSPSNIVVVDSTGLVVALAAGTATITATDSARPTPATASYQVVVTALELPLTIDSATQSLEVNDTYTRTAKNGTGTIHYSSSNPGFASVGDTNGTVRALKAGPTAITARDSLTSVRYTVIVANSTPSLEMDESPYTLRADMIVIKEQLPTNPPSSARYRRTAIGSGALKWTTSSYAVWINASTGDIVAWKNGTAIVTVSDATGQSRSFQITVSGIRTIVGLNVKGNWAETVSRAQAAGASVPSPAEIQAMRSSYNGAPPGEDIGQVWTSAMSGNNHVTNSLTTDAYATSPGSGYNGSYGIKTLP